MLGRVAGVLGRGAGLLPDPARGGLARGPHRPRSDGAGGTAGGPVGGEETGGRRERVEGRGGTLGDEKAGNDRGCQGLAEMRVGTGGTGPGATGRGGCPVGFVCSPDPRSRRRLEEFKFSPVAPKFTSRRVPAAPLPCPHLHPLSASLSPEAAADTAAPRAAAYADSEGTKGPAQWLRVSVCTRLVCSGRHKRGYYAAGRFRRPAGRCLSRTGPALAQLGDARGYVTHGFRRSNLSAKL